MLVRRLTQFLLVFASGIGFLMALKYGLGLSNYVIPSPIDIVHTGKNISQDYFLDTVNTLSVAVVGQIISIFLAFFVGIAARKSTWIGTFIKAAAYNIQAYPIVAVAPIIFILLGDGFVTRLLIAAMICYFPLLLSVVGIMSEPVPDIEHFYVVTGKINWKLEIKIRSFENIHKLVTVISGSTTLAMAGTIVSEFIAADAGIGYSIRIALYQSDLSRILIALFFIGIFISLYQGILERVGEIIMEKWNISTGEFIS